MTRLVSLCSADIAPSLLCPELDPVAVVHENPWFRIMLRGSYYTVEYERLQVVVLPVLEDSSVIMVRVRRPVIGDTPLGLPAGDSNGSETPRKSAMREFVEETGIEIADASRFVPQLPISEMPRRMPVLLNIFRVDVAMSEFDSRIAHDDDIVAVEAVPYEDLVTRIANGQIYLSAVMAIISRLLFTRCQEKKCLRIFHDK